MAVLFDLDCTLVDRNATISRYLTLLEPFPRILADDVDRVLSVLIEADGAGYRASERPGEIVRELSWQDDRTAREEEIDAHWREYFASCAVAVPSAVDVLRAFRELNIPRAW